MKKLLFIGLLVPIISLAQNKTVVSVTRFFPKNDKIIEFEKAVKNHALKYHTGEFKWRVYTIESGPDAGGYQMIEGPSNWDEIDKRGTLGAEHTNDLYKNVMPTIEKTTSMFINFREELSSVALTAFTDKISVVHVFPKPGTNMTVEKDIKLMKNMWDASKQTVAVYEASSSGPAQYSIVFRYPEGLKERDPGFRKPVKERFETSNGADAYEKWLASIATTTESMWAELLFYNADLSSK